MKPGLIAKLQKEAEEKEKEEDEIMNLKINYEMLLAVCSDPEEIARAKRKYQRKKHQYIQKWDERP